ncbi:ribonuclease H-like domain-containing protein [Candidatus Woesearchaeota archaeon]|nr:ribonuclease H-like domain-containing protein [Candidatus Woesearchaeota archaeon]
MPKLQFYPIDLTYKLVRGRAAVYMYGRTKDGKQICVIDEGFAPYFYVVPKKGVSISALKEQLQGMKSSKADMGEKGDETYEVTKTSSVKRILEGRELEAVKVTVNIPKAVPVLREEIKAMQDVEDILEYDILYTRRYLIDKKIIPLILTDVEAEPITDRAERSRVPLFKASKIEQTSNESLDDLKILAFDIETYNPDGKLAIPEKHPILMVSLYGRDFRRVITWKRFRTDLDYVEFVEGEAQLLERFRELVNEFAPDILTGYYSDGFDMPFIIKRANKYKIKMDLSLDYEAATLPRGNIRSIDTTGIVHVDIINFIRRVISRKMKTDSFRLDDVAGELLGESKDDVDIARLAEFWDRGSDELSDFAKYNLKDSRLTFELCEKVLPNLIELVKLIGQTINDLNRMSFSQLVEWYIMRRAEEFRQFIPNKPHHNELEERMGERIKGAFVFEPKPGLYENVVVFDFRSLYPSIIVSHNISIETLNCGCCKDKDRVPHEKVHLWFCRKKEGFFSTVLKEIITRRMRVKEIMKTADKKKRVFLDARQESLKVLSNSFYGYLGFFAARWYCKDCARSVTAYARHYIHQVIDSAKAKGFDVLYSDTDSVFLHLTDRSEKDAMKFCEEVNNTLPGMMELEYDGTYTRALFVAIKDAESGAKKKYALIDKEDKITIKGFETVRRNVSSIAKRTQEEVLKIILKGNDPKRAFRYVQDVVNMLRDKKAEVDDLSIPTKLTRPIESYDSIGPHVAAAKRLKAKGVDVFPGMIVRYVVTSGKERIRDRAKLPEEVKQGDYDADYYIKNQVLPAVENIFQVFGYEADELAGAKKQSKLGAYF